MHALRTALSGALLFGVFAHDAHATSGDGAGFGPVVGITWNGSLSLGWEASGSYAGPILRLVMGGSYQVRRADSDPIYFHYIAWEPWLFAGGTLGAAVTDEPDVQVLYGLWEGYAQDLGDPLFDDELDYVDDNTRNHWVLSLSVGWRGVGKTQQFYFTPKVWRIRGWDFFT
jgi:hypothetical protein